MATTLAAIVTAVRSQCDIVSSQVVTDTEIEGYVNLDLSEMWDLVIGQHEDYAVSTASATISSAADPATFALPSDWLKNRGVYRLVGSDYLPMEPISEDERVNYVGVYSISSVASYAYIIQGQNVEVFPWQSSVGTYRIRYIPKWSDVAHGGSLPTAIDFNSWHSYAISGACARVQAKQELDASRFDSERMRLQLRILDAARNRNAGSPRGVADHRGGLTDWPWHRWPRRYVP